MAFFRIGHGTFEVDGNQVHAYLDGKRTKTWTYEDFRTAMLQWLDRVAAKEKA